MGYGKDLHLASVTVRSGVIRRMVAGAGEQKGGGGYSCGSDDLLCP